jgi:hypothetical protein
MDEERFDVIVVEKSNQRVNSVVHRNIKLDKGLSNAQKLVEMLNSRLTSSFFTKIVPSGAYHSGDILKDTPGSKCG